VDRKPKSGVMGREIHPTPEQLVAARLGKDVTVLGRVVKVLDEPNTGLVVLDFGDTEAAVPVHAVVPLPGPSDPEGAQAQAKASPDMTDWTNLLTEAEGALETGEEIDHALFRRLIGALICEINGHTEALAAARADERERCQRILRLRERAASSCGDTAAVVALDAAVAALGGE
jgi:hypothetical protein